MFGGTKGFSIIAGSAALATFAWAAPDWSRLLHSGASVVYGAHWDGTAAYDENGAREFQPASVSKLYTATFAWHELGRDFRFRTRIDGQRLESDPGVVTSLRFTGDGDPTWGMSEFGETPFSRLELLADRMKASGVREIRGPIAWVSSSPIWDDWSAPSSWKAGDLIACYGARPEAFNMGLNCELYSVESAKGGRWSDTGIATKVRSELRAGAANAISVVPEGAGYVLRGTFKSRTQIAIPVHGIAPWMENLFSRVLARKGLAWSRAATDEPASEPIEWSLESPPLRELIRPFLKQSLNMMGESLLRAVAEKRGLSRADEPTLLSSFTSGFPHAGEVELHDGCGLARTSRVSPRALAAFLDALRTDAAFADVAEAMPLAGVDGTLKNRMQGTAAEGRLRAKTGTLNGVANLAGFAPLAVSPKSGVDYVAFVVLGEGDAGTVQAGANRAAAELSSLLTGTSSPAPRAAFVAGFDRLVPSPFPDSDEVRAPFFFRFE